MGKSKRKKKHRKIKQIITSIVLLIIATILTYITSNFIDLDKLFISANTVANNSTTNFNLDDIPEYIDKNYIEINNNVPYFTEEDYTTEAFEKYSQLDEKGRCGVTIANICKETMPKEGEKRESISQIKPTGWQQTKINDEYLYNRCHLIGYQLSAENSNELNLITGTKYFNVSGMLPFENEVANYIYKNKKNHVLYRVTPIFKGDNLLASGVEIEAYSVEDKGKGVCFNVYVYNVQPGVTIDYATGKVK